MQCPRHLCVAARHERRRKIAIPREEIRWIATRRIEPGLVAANVVLIPMAMVATGILADRTGEEDLFFQQIDLDDSRPAICHPWQTAPPGGAG